TPRSRTALVQRLREQLLASARLAFDEDWNVRGCEPLAERIDPAHLRARSNDVTEARCSRRDGDGRRRETLDAERRLAHAHSLASAQIHVEHGHAVGERPVRRPQILQMKPAVARLERGMAPRDVPIAQPYVACGALSDQGSRWLRPVEHDAQT